LQNYTIAIIGLGYVGLPLAMAFAEKYPVIGFDINLQRIEELNNGVDQTSEADTADLKRLTDHPKSATAVSSELFFTTDPLRLKECNIYIITVPTPVDKDNKPDLRLLIEATRTAAKTLQKGDLVIYESTVYPGCTEEIVVPILEEVSGLTFNIDFFCGYSPERINPGDKVRTLANIQKITSGSTPEAAVRVDELYKTIITAGTYLAPSIKVAEAAKVIENAQRDVNIAFVNELAKIFQLLQIDTQEVLKAAATKWNFLSFQPGLVGGHCIGVDPYYLAHKAQAVGYQPEIILAARKINDSMGEYVAGQLLRLMAQKGIATKEADILIMGIAFKENFADMRNSRVVDIIKALQDYQMNITIYDPIVSPEAVEKEYGLTSYAKLPVEKKFDGIIVAVNHKAFALIDYPSIVKDNYVVFDVKGGLKKGVAAGKL
jgi:UDP-N-acetyl-D-galactosamine dehydrogenase